MVRNWLTLALAAATLTTAAMAGDVDTSTRFMIRLAESGVYRVGWDDLWVAGLEDDLPTQRLGLRQAGRPVPIWVEDGGDGHFGPGDWLSFVGERLSGDYSGHSEHTPFNVYALDTHATAPARFAAAGELGAGICRDRTRLSTSRRYEQDLLRMRFDAQDAPQQEVWFWQKVTHIDDEPFEQTLDMSDLEPLATRPVRLRLHLRGWSQLPHDQRGKLADHRVEVRVGERLLGSVEWNNSPEGQLLEIAESSHSFARGKNRLTVSIPPRLIDPDEPPVVDVVLVNWIELSYTRNTAIDADQSVVAPVATAGCIDLQTAPGATLEVYRDDGLRVDGGPGHAETGNHMLLVDPAGWPANGTLHLVRDRNYAAPLDIRKARANGIETADRQADYIMIAHPLLLDATRPLADFYNARGLRTTLVDVTDVYDAFNDGIVHPVAIKRFLDHAWRNWQAPAPRLVLLVGDASWDARNPEAVDRNYADKTYRQHHQTRLPKNRSTAYTTPQPLPHRNLIPTWSAGTREGLAANDSWFADVEGDDLKPEMAVGRFPVVTPAEVTSIVNKSIAFAENAPVGPWRRRILWITNEYTFSQQRSDRLAAVMGERGFEASKIYPASDEPSTELNRERLLEAFDAGNALVHFFGHGGRYIWRTGPPDHTKNRDLFTLDDLEALTPNARLPVVLSMTCYSAPFDHPSADSIGEKFLRLPDRGAVAVIAAAWRNSPTLEMSTILLDALTRPGTVGEAFLHAKRTSTSRDFLSQYNLLGDPGIPLPAPTSEVAIEFVGTTPLRIRARTDLAGFSGRGVVDWLDASGAIVHTEESAVANGRLEATLTGPADGVTAVRVYLWNEADAVDALGAAAVPASDVTRLREESSP